MEKTLRKLLNYFRDNAFCEFSGWLRLYDSDPKDANARHRCRLIWHIMRTMGLVTIRESLALEELIEKVEAGEHIPSIKDAVWHIADPNWPPKDEEETE